MKKNLRVFVSSFMVGVMTATSTGIPGLSAMTAFAAEDSADDAVESSAAIEVMDEAETPTSSYAWSAPAEAITAGTQVVDNDVFTMTACADLRTDPVATLIGTGVGRDGVTPVDVEGVDGTNVRLANGGIYIGDNGYSNVIRTNGGGDNIAVDGVTKKCRPFFKIVPKKDGVLKVDCRIAANKQNVIFQDYDATDGTGTIVSAVPEVYGGGAEKLEFYTQEAEVKAGEEYWFAGVGTDAFLFGIDVVAEGAEDPTPVEDDTDLATPESGKTYTADFASMPKSEGSINGQLFAEDTIKAVVSENSNLRGDGHGTTTVAGDKFKIAVAGNAKINITTCVYANGGELVLTDASGNVVGSVKARNSEAEGHDQEADGSETPQVIDYKGEAGVLTLSFDAAGTAYIHNITVENEAKATGEAVSFSQWFDDLATEVDNGVDADGNPSTMKMFEQQTLKFGDSTLVLVGNKNTAYEDGLERFTPNNNNANFMNLTRGDRTGVNAYKAGNRNATANDITTIPQYGDGTALVFNCVGNGTFTSYVYTGSFVRVWDFDTATGERYGYTDTEVGVEFVAFQAKAGHTYVLSTTGKTNNCGFCSAEFAVDQEAEIAVNEWTTPADSTYNFDNSNFKLVDAFLGTTVGTIGKNTKSIKLNVGHTYKIESADAGVGVTFVSTGTDTFKVEEGTTQLQLALVEIPDVTLTGDIITSDGSVSDLTGLKFKNMVSGNETAAEISGDGKTYTATIKPGEYNTVIESASFTTIDRVHVDSEGENKNTVFLKAPDKALTNLPADVNSATPKFQYVSADAAAPIKFNNSTSIRMSAGDKIVVPVNGKQKVTVAGWYSGTWNINGQNEVTTNSSAGAASPTTNYYFTDGTETEVTITTTAEGANYLYWVRVDDVDEFDASNTVIQVPSEKFPTLKDANAYIAKLANRPDGEDGRMTIELTDDIEEQIVFTEPYVTVDGKGHTIHWYYGVGSFYYSIDKASGLYDEELYYDHYSANEGDGSLWGGVAIIKGDHFIAKDTTFKNTYNYEVTEKDASDFDHSAGGLVTERVAGTTEVGIYSTKERSNAFYINADDIQVYNCNILSSQDTLGRNGSANNGYHTYFKDCVIGGNVDYICGEFTAVFDNCELQWKTYTDDKNNNKIGYITAAKTSPYVFRNCVITKDDDAKAVTGQFGRTWGANSNAAFLFTQTNGTIGEDGWGEMTSGDGASATFYDYCNFNGDDDAAPATKFASEISNELVEAYTTDQGIFDILTFVPVDFMYQTTTVSDGADYVDAAQEIKVIDSASDIHTAAYEIGNDTILIAAVSSLDNDGITFKTADGTVIASSEYVYDSIELADGYTITSADLGIADGYLYAVRVVGVRSAYMTADGNAARENTVEGFSAEFGVVEEVADEAKQEEIV